MKPFYPLETLFFPIKEDTIGTNNFTIYEYFAICNQKTSHFLGIKRKKQRYLSHQQAYQTAANVYLSLTKTEAIPISWWQNEKNNLAAIVINGISAENMMYNSRNHFDSEISSNYSLKEEKHLSDKVFNANILSNLNLAIGIVNGYDIDQPCNLYLMLQWNKDVNNLKYLAISRISANESSSKIEDKFRKDFNNFIEESHNRYTTPIESQFIKPVLFNMYDQNIELTTLQNDETKLLTVQKFNEIVDKFLNSKHSLNYFAFTEFIIQNTPLFDDSLLTMRDTSNIITQSKVYQSSVSRFKNLYPNSKNRSDFEYSNYHRLEAVKHIIR